MNERVQDLAGLSKAYTHLVSVYRSMKKTDDMKMALAKVSDLSNLLQTRGVAKN